MVDKQSLFDMRTARVLFVTAYVIAIACVVLNAFQVVTIAYTALNGYIALLILTVILPLTLWLATKWRPAVALFLISLNIGGGLVFLLYVGAYNPFVLIWAIVIVLCHKYYGRLGFILSSLTLIVLTMICINLYVGTLGEQIVIFGSLSAFVSASTIILAYIVIKAIRSSKERSERLAESKKAEEMQLNRLNTLLNSISDTVLTLNRYGRITSQNAAALSFFDTNQTLVGKNIDTVINLVDSSAQPVSVKKLSENIRTTVIRDDVSVTDANDGVMRLSVQLSPIHGTFQENSEDGTVVIIRDITRQKTLEDEKDEFISVTSHELRTPIAIAEGSLGNLLFMFEKGVKPDLLKASANTAHEQVLFLARMINDLSTLSRAERGVGDVAEEINVQDLLHELYLRYQPEATEKSLKLDLDLDAKLPIITTSRLYLEEILQNFITNAIKYTKEGTVTLSGKLVDGKIECAVKDTGIGINKADQGKVFDKFFRSEDYRTRETSGTGLGLYVVSKLADKLSTKVEVKSRLNHGSTFSFILPLTSNKLGTGKRGE